MEPTEDDHIGTTRKKVRVFHMPCFSALLLMLDQIHVRDVGLVCHILNGSTTQGAGPNEKSSVVNDPFPSPIPKRRLGWRQVVKVREEEKQSFHSAIVYLM